MASLANLTDAQLADAVLRVPDPRGQPGFRRERPDRTLEPEIVGYYEVAAPTLDVRTSADMVWCCHCQKLNHLVGLVLTNETGRRYTIGNTCGPKHYGLSFNAARTTFGKVKARQAQLARVHRIATLAPQQLDEITAVLATAGLAAVDAKRNELAKASSSAASELAQAVRNGSPLQEWVTVRDFVAERRRDERRAANEPPAAPILTEESRSLGPVRGAALVRTQDDARDRLLALRRALERVAAIVRAGTEASSTMQLASASIEVEQAHRAAGDALAEARRAPDFFAPAHLDALARWAEYRRGFTLRAVGVGLELANRDARPVLVAPIGAVEVPDLPSLSMQDADEETAEMADRDT